MKTLEERVEWLEQYADVTTAEIKDLAAELGITYGPPKYPTPFTAPPFGSQPEHDATCPYMRPPACTGCGKPSHSGKCETERTYEHRSGGDPDPYYASWHPALDDCFDAVRTFDTGTSEFRPTPPPSTPSAETEAKEWPSELPHLEPVCRCGEDDCPNPPSTPPGTIRRANQVFGVPTDFKGGDPCESRSPDLSRPDEADAEGPTPSAPEPLDRCGKCGHPSHTVRGICATYKCLCYATGAKADPWGLKDIPLSDWEDRE